MPFKTTTSAIDGIQGRGRIDMNKLMTEEDGLKLILSDILRTLVTGLIYWST